MSVELNPDINNLDKDGLCYKIYNQLYHSFFNAHDKKDEAHPWGITEGDEISIRLHNTAYVFAEAIAGSIESGGTGGGGEGGILIDYLKKSGGNMTGLLRSNCGFEAGIENTRILETFKRIVAGENGEQEVYGISVTGNLEVGGSDFIIGGKNVIAYHKQTDTTSISGYHINIDGTVIRSTGEFIIGKDKTTGVFISPAALLVNGNTVYHSGNANKETIDWTMKQGVVAGDLSVKGKTKLSGFLSAPEGFELGIDNSICFYIDKHSVIHVNTSLSFSNNNGIQIDDSPILLRINDKDIQLGAIEGDILIGSARTNKVKLFTDLFDTGGEYRLLSRYGGAYFPDSLSVRHNYGELLLSTYRVDNDDEGVIINKKLRFENSQGAYLTGDSNGIVFSSKLIRFKDSERFEFNHETQFKYEASESCYQPLDRLSNSLFINTDSDFFVYKKPLEVKGHIGISNSFTRLTEKGLYFNSGKYILSGTEGIKHYGNSYFINNVSSEYFSSGLSGSGWAIINNMGNVTATFDSLVIRKRIHVYELDVQKITATSGSLWISDSCSGDMVRMLYD